MNNELNSYDIHNIVTLDGKYTYEKPIYFKVIKTAYGGWWGKATFADGKTLNKFRSKPSRQIPVKNI
jgi:hypothetical protein